MSDLYGNVILKALNSWHHNVNVGLSAAGCVVFGWTGLTRALTWDTLNMPWSGGLGGD